MLGRELGEVRREGLTKFTGDHHTAGAEPVLAARDLTAPHKLHGISVSIRPGEVVGLGGLLGSGRTSSTRSPVCSRDWPAHSTPPGWPPG